MNFTVEFLDEMKLVGVSSKMNLLNNKTHELCMSFMPRQKEIKNRVSNNLISMQVYEFDYFKHFKPENNFIKWAAVEVLDVNTLPNGFESFIIPKGNYAVFNPDSGKAENSFLEKIFTQWLPNSGYAVDGRPHFEMITTLSDLPADYQEVIFIPVFRL